MSRKNFIKSIAAVGVEKYKEQFTGKSDRAQFNLGSIASRLSGAAGGGNTPTDTRRGIPTQSAKEGADYFDIQEGDFQNTFGNNLTAGVWSDLAEFVVGAQNAYNIGWGIADAPDVVGRWYMVLDDGAGNEVVGQARIKTRNSNDERVDTEIRGVPTSRLNTDPNDFRKQYAMPENRETDKVGEDSKAVLQFKLSSASAGTSVDFTAAATEVSIPASNYS